MNKIVQGTMTLIVASLCQNAFAVTDGMYMGLDVGVAKIKYDTFTAGSPPATVTTSSSPIGLRLHMGYQFNQYAGFESGYTYFSRQTFSTSTSISNNTPSARLQSLDFLGKGIFSIQKFSVFGKLGGAAVYVTTSGSLQPPLSNKFQLRPEGAIGASYDFTQNWVVDLTASRIFGKNSGDSIPSINFISVGFSYHFVDDYCGQFLC